MDFRRVVGATLVLLAVGVLVLTQFPGLLIGEPGPYEETTVTAVDENGTQLATVEVRIADTRPKRFTGLSETDSLGPDEGMLFVHENVEEHGYVMRGMSFPLDIIFVDSDGTVVRIIHASVDGDDAPYRARAKYVLEVERGWSNRTGLDTGDRIEVPGDVQAQ